MDIDHIALFRFECLQPLLNAPRGQVEAMLADICGKPVEAPNGRTCVLSRATILRWLRNYRLCGLNGLKSKPRKDRGSCRRIDDETASALIELKQQHPSLTVPALIYQARLRKIVSSGRHLPKASVWRLLKNHGLMDKKALPQVDRRRFEADSPLELVQSDIMHGPRIHGKKTYLVALIDDHSRLILWAEFKPHETVEDFLAVLIEALSRRGLPRKIYVDNGSAYRSKRIAYALANLGIAFIHATPYQPEGKGKCERWFRTVRENFMPQLSPDDLESLATINQALWKWIDDYYHQTTHSSTGQAPLERFIAHLHVARPAPDNLKSIFRSRIIRKVAKDRSISFNGKVFEAPLGTIGKKLELRFDPQKPDDIEVFDSGKSLGSLPILLVHSNVRIRRNRNLDIDIEPKSTTGKIPTGRVPF